jgi:hypothetical protein
VTIACRRNAQIAAAKDPAVLVQRAGHHQQQMGRLVRMCVQRHARARLNDFHHCIAECPFDAAKADHGQG